MINRVCIRDDKNYACVFTCLCANAHGFVCRSFICASVCVINFALYVNYYDFNLRNTCFYIL